MRDSVLVWTRLDAALAKHPLLVLRAMRLLVRTTLRSEQQLPQEAWGPLAAVHDVLWVVTGAWGHVRGDDDLKRAARLLQART